MRDKKKQQPPEERTTAKHWNAITRELTDLILQVEKSELKPGLKGPSKR